MKRIALSSVAFAATLLLGACGETTGPVTDQASTPAPATQETSAPETVAVSATGLPDVPKAYRRLLDRAWETAGEGKDPTMSCTTLIARAAGNAPTGNAPKPESVRAFEICYVDVRVRYLESLLDGTGDDAESDGEESRCARIVSHLLISRSSIGSFAPNVGLTAAELDRRVAERVGAQMREICPDQVELLTGNG